MVDSLRVGTSQQIDIPENVNPNVPRNKSKKTRKYMFLGNFDSDGLTVVVVF